MNEENVTFDEFIKSNENRQKLLEALSIVLLNKNSRFYSIDTSFEDICKHFNVPEDFLKEAITRKKIGDLSFLNYITIDDFMRDKKSREKMANLTRYAVDDMYLPGSRGFEKICKNFKIPEIVLAEAIISKLKKEDPGKTLYSLSYEMEREMKKTQDPHLLLEYYKIF